MYIRVIVMFFLIDIYLNLIIYIRRMEWNWLVYWYNVTVVIDVLFLLFYSFQHVILPLLNQLRNNLCHHSFLPQCHQLKKRCTTPGTSRNPGQNLLNSYLHLIFYHFRLQLFIRLYRRKIPQSSYGWEQYKFLPFGQLCNYPPSSFLVNLLLQEFRCFIIFFLLFSEEKIT